MSDGVDYFLPGTIQPDVTGAGFVLKDNRPDPDVINDTEKYQEAVQAYEDAYAVYKIALPILFGIIIAAGIIGNVLVLIVITTRRKLQTVTNLLLLNLAVADIVFLLLCGPLTAMHYAVQSWTLGNSVCQMIQYLLYVTCYVTIYTLVAVAIVRYLLVVKGGQPACVTNIRSMIFVILGIWSACLVANIPVPLNFGTSLNPDTNTTQCIISCEQAGQQIFFTLFFLFSYAVPLIIVGSFYVLLVRHLVLEQRSSMLKKSQSSTEKGKGGSRKSSRVTRVLVLVVSVFALCWLPLHIHLLWGSFGQLPNSFTYRMCVIAWHALIFINSALNPIIYNLASSEFREAFSNICHPHLGREGSSNSGSGSRALLKSSSTKSSSTKSSSNK